MDVEYGRLVVGKPILVDSIDMSISGFLGWNVNMGETASGSPTASIPTTSARGSLLSPSNRFDVLSLQQQLRFIVDKLYLYKVRINGGGSQSRNCSTKKTPGAIQVQKDIPLHVVFWGTVRIFDSSRPGTKIVEIGLQFREGNNSEKKNDNKRLIVLYSSCGGGGGRKSERTTPARPAV